MRPKKNNVDYFPHDNNMRNDRKIKAVRARFGTEAYAIYCMILETLAEENFLQIPYTEANLDMLAGDFSISVYRLREVLNYFLRDGIALFAVQDGMLRCPQLERRVEPVFQKRGKLLQELRRNVVSGAETPHNPVVSGTESTQSKVKESKEKNINTSVPTQTKIAFDVVTGAWMYILEKDFKIWRDAYPACDIQQELYRAAAWIVANPQKGKKKNYRRFLTNWLARCQERGGTHGFSADKTLTADEQAAILRQAEC